MRSAQRKLDDFRSNDFELRIFLPIVRVICLCVLQWIFRQIVRLIFLVICPKNY